MVAGGKLLGEMGFTKGGKVGHFPAPLCITDPRLYPLYLLGAKSGRSFYSLPMTVDPENMLFRGVQLALSTHWAFDTRSDMSCVVVFLTDYMCLCAIDSHAYGFR